MNQFKFMFLQEKDSKPRKTVQRVTKRREKNRDAARKSRRKQTERADELHEELQDLEQSNSAFLKEIAELKKDLLFYQMTLERHKPYCCLRASGSPSHPHLKLPLQQKIARN
uniref:Basic leucine zipper transcriptional factor ATF-like 2 n=1 Tax=Oryzias latipes TaxID=8090 RepID=A0A3P9M6R0_ORYLA